MLGTNITFCKDFGSAVSVKSGGSSSSTGGRYSSSGIFSSDGTRTTGCLVLPAAREGSFSNDGSSIGTTVTGSFPFGVGRVSINAATSSSSDADFFPVDESALYSVRTALPTAALSRSPVLRERFTPTLSPLFIPSAAAASGERRIITSPTGFRMPSTTTLTDAPLAGLLTLILSPGKYPAARAYIPLGIEPL